MNWRSLQGVRILANEASQAVEKGLAAKVIILNIFWHAVFSLIVFVCPVSICLPRVHFLCSGSHSCKSQRKRWPQRSRSPPIATAMPARPALRERDPRGDVRFADEGHGAEEVRREEKGPGEEGGEGKD